MPIEGTYEPSPSEWVRDQVEAYERSGGSDANTLRDTGLSIVVVTTVGNKSGKVRKTPLMRVEHNGEYALVASKGGAPTHPVWYHNLLADPETVQIQDGPEPADFAVREVSGEERELWWDRAVKAYPPYAEYQEKTDRLIPVFVATRRG
ncbi:MAG TPA: nitroreductase family deazaflavin-dependent oxidoreductase [Acidimicrobiales bacterium]